MEPATRSAGPRGLTVSCQYRPRTLRGEAFEKPSENTCVQSFSVLAAGAGRPADDEAPLVPPAAACEGSGPPRPEKEDSSRALVSSMTASPWAVSVA